MRDLNDTQTLVLCEIVKRVGEGRVDPTYREIAGELGLGLSQAHAAVRVLRAKGYLAFSMAPASIRTVGLPIAIVFPLSTWLPLMNAAIEDDISPATLIREAVAAYVGVPQ